jgi:TonB-dependent receptor
MSTHRNPTRLVALRGASLLAIMACTAANAQQTPASAPAKSGAAQAGEVQELVVTGYRKSLESALVLKRNAILPIDSIAPEDIGKLPDQNVAEALQRLPGIQIDRSQGQGTTVLIDGLRQNLTTLNGDIFLTGKEISVSGENSGGGSGAGNQYSSLEGIPSEEISGIDVYKNPSAALVEGGLGGIIDLKTRDPLAGPVGFTLGGNARATTAEGDGTWTPVGALVASYKFNDTLGVTASVSYDSEFTHTKEFQDQNRSAWIVTDSSMGPNPGDGTNAAATALPNNQYYIDPQLAYLTDQYDKRRILGTSFGIAWKPADAITTSFNWFYSRESDANISYSDKIWFNGQNQCLTGSVSSPGSPPCNPGAASNYALPGIAAGQPYAIDANGVVQNATFSANGAETATLYQHDVSEANNFQWVTKYDPGGPLKAELGVFFARGDSNFQAAQADVEHGLYNTSAGVATSPAAPGCNNGASTCGGGNPGYQFAYTNGGASGLPTINYLAPNADVLSNPAYATFKSNWAWANYTSQKDWAVKGDVQYKPSFISNVDAVFTAGFRVAGRDVDQTFGRYLINGTLPDGQVAGNVGGGASAGPYLYYQDPGYGTPNIPYSTATSDPGLVKVVNNFGAGSIIVKDPATLEDPSTYLEKVWSGAGVPNNTERLFVDGLSSFRVNETTYTGYVMGDIGAPTDHFHVNFGVRLVETDLTINNGQAAASPTYYGTASWNGVDSNVVPVQTNRNYFDVLPTFNATVDLTDTQKIRFGAARVVAPQDLFSLGLGNTYGFTRSGSGTTFVFDGGSSGNTQLDPYRATQFNTAYENYFARGGIASVAFFYKSIDSFVEQQNVAVTVAGTTADVSEPVNGGPGYIYGVELGFQYAFDGTLFWSGLKGLGVAANYTRSESSSHQVTAFSTTGPIPGVSKDSLTVTGYYERHGFSIRASYSWRDQAVNDSPVGSTFAISDQNGNPKIYQVFAAPYGQLDGQVGYDITDRIGVTASIQNITNSSLHTYLEFPNLPFTYENSGRRYYLGVRFKF